MTTKKRKLTKPSNKSPYRQYDFVIDKKRYCGSTGTADEKLAERFARTVWEAARDEAAERRKAVGRMDMTWQEASDDYLAFKGDYASRKADLWLRDWVSERFGGRSYISKLDHVTLAALVTEMRNRDRYGIPGKGKVSNAHVNMLTIFVRKILTRARVELGTYLPREPKYGRLLLKEKARKSEMMVGQQVLIEQVATEDLRLVVEFILQTGMRRGAALLKWSQVHLEEGVMHIVTKGNNFQEVPITPEVRALLLRAAEDERRDPVHVWTWRAPKEIYNPRTGERFHAGQRYPYQPQGLLRRWKLACREVGLNFTIHDLRKTFGARIVRETGDIKTAQEALGHAKIGMTATHYSHILGEDTRRRLAVTTNRTNERLEQARLKLTKTDPGCPS